MNLSEVDILYPVVGFVRDPELGLLTWRFLDWDDLSACQGIYFDNGWPAQLELIDAGLGRWKVTSARKIGRPGRLIPWLIAKICGAQSYRIEYEVERLPSVSLTELQDLVREDIEQFGQENDHLPEHYIETASRVAEVQAASTVSEIIALADWDGMSSHLRRRRPAAPTVAYAS
jgi:hypothetical protein